jgi:hypothetical protein
MPTPTYTPLATATLGSSAASVTFSSIPATYRDLIAVYNGAAATGGDLYMTLNADSSNYSMVRMGAIPSVNSQAESTREIGFARTDSSVVIAQIMDYSATDKHKTTLSRTSGSGAVLAAYASRYASTSAITSVGFTINGGHSFTAGSTFSLYGVIA